MQLFGETRVKKKKILSKKNQLIVFLFTII